MDNPWPYTISPCPHARRIELSAPGMLLRRNRGAAAKHQENWAGILRTLVGGWCRTIWWTAAQTPLSGGNHEGDSFVGGMRPGGGAGRHGRSGRNLEVRI